MAKYIVGIIVLAALIIGGVWYAKREAPVDQAAQNTQESSGKMVFTWNITSLEESTEVPGMPRSKVSVTSGGKTYDVGEFDGACAEIDGTSWPLVEGEKTGVICWWAGGGSEAGIFEEGGKMVIKVGILDEGNAEVPGVRGNFQTIATIE